MTDRAPRVIVVGSGIAGLTAARHARDAGCAVTLITKGTLADANTRYAQGGIAAVTFDDDRVSDHVHDTLVAGAGLCVREAVTTLAADGAARIDELVALGVAFDRDATGAWVKGLEAAHSYPRILHAGGDATGAVIEKALVARLRESQMEIIEHAFLADLVVDDGRVRGVQVLIGGDTPRVLSADAVILATGGAGQLYAHTTNPRLATGDGVAAALRAGVDVADLEFFQFHPTVLPRTEHDDPFLISEAVRGEGAVLRDVNGQRFMPHVHPDAELAPRDVVARTIADVMHRQNGAPVLLDATAVGPHPGDAAATADFLAHRFPTIDAAVRSRGLDWARRPIPVTPAAHYIMGGITTDLHGRTTLPGLYAVGEVARTGVHGANRLASNSLLEGAVFGARAGDTVSEDIRSRRWPTSSPHHGIPSPSTPRPGTSDSPGADAYGHEAAAFTRAALQALLWRDAGVVRDAGGLTRAAITIARWRAMCADQTLAPSPADAVAAREDANLLLLAEALVHAARARTHSVGAHFRADADLDARIDLDVSAVITEPHHIDRKVPA